MPKNSIGGNMPNWGYFQYPQLRKIVPNSEYFFVTCLTVLPLLWLVAVGDFTSTDDQPVSAQALGIEEDPLN